MSSPWSDVGASSRVRSGSGGGIDASFPPLVTMSSTTSSVNNNKSHVEHPQLRRPSSASSRGPGSVSRPHTPPASRPAALSTAALPVESPNVPGFFAWRVDDRELMRSLRTAVISMFEQRKGQPKHGRRRMSDVIELGVIFASAEKLNKFEFAEDTESRDAQKMILRFIAAQLAQHRTAVATAAGCHPVPFNDHNINVVVRRYRPGQSIGFHTDRVEKLDDMVWSVVVDCGEPDDGLHFELPDGSKVPVPEFPGLVSVQTGPARNTYKHGVSSVKHERISITWRHFLPTYLEKLEPEPCLAAPNRMRWFLQQVQHAAGSLPQTDAAAVIRSRNTTPSSPTSLHSSSCSPSTSVTSSPTHVADPLPASVVPPLAAAAVLALSGNKDDTSSKQLAEWPPKHGVGAAPVPPPPFLASPRGTMSEALGSAYRDVSQTSPRAKIGVITSPMGGTAGTGSLDEQRRLVIRHLCASVGEVLGERFPGGVSVLCCDDQQNNENLGALAAGLRLSNPDAPFRALPERGRPALEADQVRFTDAADVYLLIEGGFDSAVLARQVEEAGKPLIRLACSGGAAADWFGLLKTPALPGPYDTVDPADAQVLQSTPLAHRDWRQRVNRVADAASNALTATMQAQAGPGDVTPPILCPPPALAPHTTAAPGAWRSSPLAGLDAHLKSLTLDPAPCGKIHPSLATSVHF